MALEEIEKLRQRVEKDPNSRLFLPLAEEYRKSGMPDEAITVLLNGLKQHAGYTSARVALGRIYLEKNMLSEAQLEFEEVIRSVPDNLFAHRKLADIYRELGETEKAVTEYRTVLVLNPLDEDAQACLETLETIPSEGATSALSPEGKAAAARETLLEAAGGEETAEEIMEEGILAAELPEGEVTGIVKSEDFGKEFEEFSRSLSQQLEDEPEAGVFVIGADSPEPVHPAGVSGEVPPSGEGSYAAMRAEIEAADSLITSGDYSEAINLYRGLLTRYPENRDLLQRVAELRAFLKLIGKGEELMIARLEAFREGIKRRFSASSE
ncbi:MAG TPA: tetratricopeptide repeat protein [Thermodesulfovibrionales bacterium]|nr:tetratricopeptide repeat protein [Thermodesulfovibrionales bacterium]